MMSCLQNAFGDVNDPVGIMIAAVGYSVSVSCKSNSNALTLREVGVSALEKEIRMKSTAVPSEAVVASVERKHILSLEVVIDQCLHRPLQKV